jgi:hypothetical protein
MRVPVDDRQPVRADDDPQPRVGGVADHRLEPALEPRAVLDQHVGVAKRRDGVGRGLEVLGRDADRHERANVGSRAGRAPRDRGERRGGGDDAERPARALGRPM